ncbi:MAG: OsmC family protein [Bryobacteraceae bacterium]
MQVNIQWQNGAAFEVEARGHRVVCDQPQDNGGEDSGLTPPEFLLAALGSCVAYYAAEYLKTRNLNRDGLKVRVEAEKALQPARLAQFRIELQLPAGLDQRHREGALRAGQRCLVHNTLLHAPSIEIAVAEAPAVAA